jgi:Mycothiol maleylpyruvate isomerase N-terminal domain
MRDPRGAELLLREAAAWESFLAQVERVGHDDRERAGALEGWSVKDLVWHCAHWTDFCAAALEDAGDGPFVDPFDAEPDEYWHEENARVARESAPMSWRDAREGADAARTRVRSAIGGLARVDEATARFFGDETFVHYDEHAEHVAAFARRVARDQAGE